MQFVLTGFKQDMGSRVFAFDGVGPDRSHTAFTVRADLALSRKYGIAIQELPLLCRSCLERREEGLEGRTFTFTEEEMRSHSLGVAAIRDEAARRRKPPRRPVPQAHGNSTPA